MAFLEHIKAMPRLIIAGGGHIGKALAHLASLLEFEVSVVDDRPEFASQRTYSGCRPPACERYRGGRLRS